LCEPDYVAIGLAQGAQRSSATATAPFGCLKFGVVGPLHALEMHLGRTF
jgi:hypothetical protein